MKATKWKFFSQEAIQSKNRNVGIHTALITLFLHEVVGASHDMANLHRDEQTKIGFETTIYTKTKKHLKHKNTQTNKKQEPDIIDPWTTKIMFSWPLGVMVCFVFEFWKKVRAEDLIV